MTGDVDYVLLNDVIKMSNVVGALKAAIAEFGETVAGEDREQPYYVFASFARFIQRVVENRQQEGNDALLRRAFAFVNRLSDIHGDVENLVDIEVVRALATTPQTAAAGRELLAERPRRWLEARLSG